MTNRQAEHYFYALIMAAVCAICLIAKGQIVAAFIYWVFVLVIDYRV